MNRDYPLTLPSLAVGALVGGLIGLLADSLLVGFAVVTLFVVVGATWIRNRPAIFPFIFLFQWVAITVGYFYSLATGIFPSVYALGDLERTIWLSLSALLLLAAGIRLACSIGPHQPAEPVEEDVEIHNLQRLFWLVMAVYSVHYFYVINPRVYSSVGVILARVLDFRQVLLLALWYEVLRRRVRMHYLWITLAWVFVPLLGAYFSDFKTPLILLFIVYASFWKAWERGAWRFRPRQIVIGLVVVSALSFVVLLWQAGVKKETRKAYDAETVGRGPVARISLFLDSASANLPVLYDDPQGVVEGLVERVSYITFFSRVLDHVPTVQPHTNGELLSTAITNAVMPRFLFPNKPELPSDSVYTRRFTGIWVPEEGTSISIGYLAEFYVDWGVAGMMIMVFLWGCWIGIAHRVLARWTRPSFLVNPVIITVLIAVLPFEQQFIKAFAALNIAVIVTLGMVFVFRAPLIRFLDVRTAEENAEQKLGFA